MIEVPLAQACGPAGVAPDLAQQEAEALTGERGLRDLAAPVSGPQVVVDPLVRGDRRRGAGEPEGREGFLERSALGPVEIEKSVVDVEEDGAEGRQAAYLAR